MNRRRSDLGDGRQIWEFQRAARHPKGLVVERPHGVIGAGNRPAPSGLSSWRTQRLKQQNSEAQGFRAQKQRDAGEDDQKPENPDLERKKKRGREEKEKE
ncbi:hypothetical protein SLEP1_g26824 [Rubroshorea leprosula]|uniref:Uncharacterized protein n=1 Tax=Rubroshorea leprosula TaxID=152421 RepID=A0AAV5JX20_9ROSI|nr:hypothetical protein SLEP1_g26824 [Rubroshorea leprosula]